MRSDPRRRSNLLGPHACPPAIAFVVASGNPGGCFGDLSHPEARPAQRCRRRRRAATRSRATAWLRLSRLQQSGRCRRSCVVLAAVGISASAGGDQPMRLLATARVVHRPGGWAAVIAVVGVAGGVPLRQSRSGCAGRLLWGETGSEHCSRPVRLGPGKRCALAGVWLLWRRRATPRRPLRRGRCAAPGPPSSPRGQRDARARSGCAGSSVCGVLGAVKIS